MSKVSPERTVLRTTLPNIFSKATKGYKQTRELISVFLDEQINTVENRTKELEKISEIERKNKEINELQSIVRNCHILLRILDNFYNLNRDLMIYVDVITKLASQYDKIFTDAKRQVERQHEAIEQSQKEMKGLKIPKTVI